MHLGNLDCTKASATQSAPISQLLEAVEYLALVHDLPVEDLTVVLSKRIAKLATAEDLRQQL
jgi:hypothetical protein